jgi:hypothetical protein
MDSSLPEFQRIQYGFAAYIRDPSGHSMPEDVESRRMNTYRELFFNNIENFLASGFPVLKSILVGERWIALVQDFFARHQSKTPLFAGIAEEFLDYLANERTENDGDPPFLQELAHYEWVELALAISEAEPLEVNADLFSDPLGQIIGLSEVAWPLAYRFPVHHIGPQFQPLEPNEPATCLVVYRNREEVVRFLEVNSVTYRLLALLGDRGPCLAVECLLSIAAELGYPEPHSILAHGADILRGLAQRDIIVKRSAQQRAPADCPKLRSRHFG